MSCIAMSIGLGNVWRFPFTAYENGGGVFLIPYIIVLFVVGKPFYYLEMILGQFTSRSSVKIWSAGIILLSLIPTLITKLNNSLINLFLLFFVLYVRVPNSASISWCWLGPNVFYDCRWYLLLFFDINDLILFDR